jgi:putative addiction module component (TIGR02574 family)
MIAERIPEIANLTREERLQLACELYQEDLVLHPDPEMDEAIGKLLQERMEEYRRNPDAAIPWEEFRKKWGRPVDE